MPKKALLLGATGLTGGILLGQLLESPLYSSVIIYVRKSIERSHPKLTQLLVDFETIDTAVEADDVFCCLGTTIKIAGTKAAFEKVDLHYPVKIATLQRAAGSKQLLVISAMGADSKSSIFYSRTKGLMEAALQKIGYPSLSIFRPSFITGNRKEKRMGEQIGLAIAKLINPIMVGPLRNYSAVKAAAIVDCMIHHATESQPGVHIILSGAIKAFE